MNRSSRVVVIIVAAVLCVGMGGFAATRLLADPSYALTQVQRDQINESARSGSNGLTGFERTYEYPNGMFNHERDKTDVADVPPVKVGDSFVSSGSLEQLAFINGVPSRKDGKEMGEITSFTPSTTKNGVYVTYYRQFTNAMTNVRETAVHYNSNTSLFGNDGLVSADEMLAFFNDPTTELVSLKHDEDDILWKCVVDLEFRGNTLRTDAADDCPRFIDDSSTDQLVADLVDWYVN
jgi:hypothetical protein